MKRHSFIWTSFSDLMTSLFFIMLVLFVLTVVMLEKNHEQTAILHEKTDSLYKTTRARLDRINEIEEGVKRIDRRYFSYNEQYKKHILTIDARFPVGESSIYLLTSNTQEKLLDAGRTISRFMQEEHDKNPNVKYLLIVEGQASGGYYHYHTDDYRNNDVLSYQRALGLWNFWKQRGIRFGEECEPLICGSGEGGVPREINEELNQRFLVHIVLKPGTFDSLADDSLSTDDAPSKARPKNSLPHDDGKQKVASFGER